MASLFQSGIYGDINTSDNTTNGFYFIQFISEAYMLQNDRTTDGQVIYDDELVVKAQYICSMQESINWYWKQQPLKQTIIVPTHIILHPRLYLIIIRYVLDTPKNICIRNQAENSIPIHPIIITDADYDYI